MLTNQELRQLPNKELQEELARSARELMKAKIDHKSGTLKETHKLKELKRAIARMKTVMNENAKSLASTKVASVKK